MPKDPTRTPQNDRPTKPPVESVPTEEVASEAVVAPVEASSKSVEVEASWTPPGTLLSTAAIDLDGQEHEEAVYEVRTRYRRGPLTGNAWLECGPA